MRLLLPMGVIAQMFFVMTLQLNLIDMIMWFKRLGGYRAGIQMLPLKNKRILLNNASRLPLNPNCGN
ncbi:hypothetical protein EZS27_043697, partial [termite gut metagenome]